MGLVLNHFLTLAYVSSKFPPNGKKPKINEKHGSVTSRAGFLMNTLNHQRIKAQNSLELGWLFISWHDTIIISKDPKFCLVKHIWDKSATIDEGVQEFYIGWMRGLIVRHTIGQYPSASESSLGCMLTSFGYSLLSLGIFYGFLKNDRYFFKSLKNLSNSTG
jgi:hypothetical protein